MGIVLTLVGTGRDAHGFVRACMRAWVSVSVRAYVRVKRQNKNKSTTINGKATRPKGRQINLKSSCSP